MKELRPIAAQKGDSWRIDDAYEEVSQTKKLWNKYFHEEKSGGEYKKFLGHYAKTYFSAHRDEIKRNFFPQGLEKHPFADLFDSLPLSDLPDMRGLPTFAATAELALEKLPQIVRDRALFVLYLASGSHAAVLFMAMKLMDENQIGRADFIFTEINESCYADLQRILGQGLAKGVFDKVEYFKPQTFEGEEGSEARIVITYQGKPITLTFALKRSSKDYFRTEYLAQTDVVVIHDPGSKGEAEDSFDLLANVLMAKKSKGIARERLLVMEGVEPYKANFLSAGSLFPEGMWIHSIAGPYGHCASYDGVGEVEQCVYKEANVLWLNDPTLQKLAEESPNAPALKYKLYRPEIKPQMSR